MILKPGMLLVRHQWPKELVIYLGWNNTIKESKGFLIYDEHGHYYGNVVYFDHSQDYSVVNNSTEYLRYIKKHKRKG